MTGPANNILVIKLGALGDFVQALGPMAAIRAAHRNARISLLTTAPFLSLGRACGYFDDIIIDCRPRWHNLGGWMTLRQILNNGRFARVYDLQNNDRTSFYFRLFSPRPQWVGVASGASHRNASPERTAGKAYDGHVQTLALAGIENIQPDTLSWMQGRNDFSGLNTPYVLIVPGGSPQHPHKRWPVPHYVEVCRRLASRGLLPVLIGSDAERGVTDDIARQAAPCLNLTGQTTLFDLAALARGAFGALGNDTGPMHLIAPTGCPSIILFSKGTNPRRHAPLGRDVLTLQKDSLEDLKPDDVWKAFAAQHTLS